MQPFSGKPQHEHNGHELSQQEESLMSEITFISRKLNNSVGQATPQKIDGVLGWDPLANTTSRYSACPAKLLHSICSS